MAVICGLGVQPAFGAWVGEGKVAAEGSYEDNTRLTSEDEDDAYVTAVTGEGTVRQVTESSEVRATAGVTVVNYAGAEDLDNEDIEYAQLVAVTRGERSRLRFAGSYRRDVLLRTVGDIGDPLDGVDGGAPPPDDDLGNGDTDNGIVREQIRRNLINLRPSFGYQLTEQSSVTLGYYFQDRSYEDADQFQLQDSQLQGVTLGLSTALSELNTARITVGASRFDPQDDIETDAYDATVGWDHRFSDTASAGIDVGMRYAERDSDGDSGFLLRVRGLRQTEVGVLFASAERSLRPTGYGTLDQTDRFNLRLDTAVTDRWGYAVTADAYRTETIEGQSFRDRDYASLGAELNWSLDPAWSIGTYYRYQWIDRQDDGTASGNAVGIVLTYQPVREI